MWNFSETVRVCFTCYRVMGEEGRKKYERGIVKGESKKAGYAMKAVVGILAAVVVIVVAGVYLFGKPIAEQVAMHRMMPAESRVVLGR